MTPAIRTGTVTDTGTVPAPDGTPLATDLCLPGGHGPFPAVLIRTPYDRQRHRAELRGWARRGFAALAQDVRGRHGSAGAWDPYHQEASDGAATARWVREQPWNDGTLVAAGASYAAYCALTLALDTDDSDARPDAVLAAVPALGAAETAREPSGPERLLARAGWWAAHGDRPDSDEDALAKALAGDPALLGHLPLLDLPERLGRELPSWPGLWRESRRDRLIARAATAGMPLLAVGGSHDPFAADTVRLWQRWGGDARPPARLLMGPWGHGLTSAPGPDATGAHRIRLGELYARWARAALAGRLAPGWGGASALGGSTLWLRAGEERGEQGEERDEEPDEELDEPEDGLAEYRFGEPAGLRLLRGAEFTADPEHPVRSDDLTVPADDGIADRCLLVTRPLPRPLDLFGAAEVRLRASADTADADWAARLIALTPRGAAQPLATGIVRRRDGSARTCDIQVPLGRVARRLPAGTRLRLEIAGHHFPAHARNPHTGEDPVTATRLQPSRRAVELGQSALRLPVVWPRTRTSTTDPVQEICR